MRQQMREMGRICSPRTAKMATTVMGMSMICYIAGPPLYWHLLGLIADVNRFSCPPCTCDCSSFPLFSLPQDCMKPDDEDSGEESQRSNASILIEKLRMKESEAVESQHRAETALLEAKKLTSQFQKDADKCTSGMETCEEAKEKAEVALELQRKLNAMWEMRARQKGWKEHNDTSS
ncbi:hypothetical protein V2J09_002847 [Rumex salicifolius]